MSYDFVTDSEEVFIELDRIFSERAVNNPFVMLMPR